MGCLHRGSYRSARFIKFNKRVEENIKCKGEVGPVKLV